MKRTSQLGLLLLAAALYGASVWLRPSGPSTTGDIPRALSRPFALPFLWRSLSDARHEESPEALAVRGEQLLALVPNWSDGHIWFASQLAIVASGRATDPNTATDRLVAALAMLERACERHPRGRVDYLCAMASFVDIRTARDPRVGAILAERSGQPATALADAYLARAEAAKPGLNLNDQRTYLLSRSIENALRAGDTDRALDTIAAMQRRLLTTQNRSLAAAWQAALTNLSRYLRRDPDITLTDLNDDPLLTDMLAALHDSQTNRSPR